MKVLLVATEISSSHGIGIAGRDVGGDRSRKIKLETGTGVVYLTALGNAQ